MSLSTFLSSCPSTYSVKSFHTFCSKNRTGFTQQHGTGLQFNPHESSPSQLHFNLRNHFRATSRMERRKEGKKEKNRDTERKKKPPADNCHWRYVNDVISSVISHDIVWTLQPIGIHHVLGPIGPHPRSGNVIRLRFEYHRKCTAQATLSDGPQRPCPKDERLFPSFDREISFQIISSTEIIILSLPLKVSSFFLSALSENFGYGGIGWVAESVGDSSLPKQGPATWRHYTNPMYFSQQVRDCFRLCFFTLSLFFSRRFWNSIFCDHFLAFLSFRDPLKFRNYPFVNSFVCLCDY